MRSAIITTPSVHVVHANALHGILASGFPAPTAWIGLLTAINLQDPTRPWTLTAITALPYSCKGVTYKSKHGKRFSPPRAPVKEDGKVAGIQEVQGGYANLEVAFAFKVDFEGPPEVVADQVMAALLTMRFAGGSIYPLGQNRASLLPLSGDPSVDAEAFSSYLRKWALSSVLILRPEVLQEHQERLKGQGLEATKMATWYDLFAWDQEHGRPVKGWLVPVTTGFQAVSPLYPPGEVSGTRDPCTPFCFVESIWTVGEWVSPFQLNPEDKVFFRPSFDPQTGTYRCLPEPYYG